VASCAPNALSDDHVDMWDLEPTWAAPRVDEEADRGEARDAFDERMEVDAGAGIDRDA